MHKTISTKVAKMLGIDISSAAPIVLFFKSENCGPCKTALPRAEGYAVEHGTEL